MRILNIPLIQVNLCLFNDKPPLITLKMKSKFENPDQKFLSDPIFTSEVGLWSGTFLENFTINFYIILVFGPVVRSN